MIIAFHKPYGVISQFTPHTVQGTENKESSHRLLSEFDFPKGVYPLGRLDWDSEGLLLLSDENKWNDLLLHPRHAHQRTYHAQVDRLATEEAMRRLEKGVVIQGYKTLPCKACLIDDPGHAERVPPIRFRLSVPTSWIELKLIEGKNRQVRRMTAAVGFPTLRLIRVAIGGFSLRDLPQGQWHKLSPKQQEFLLL